MSVLRIWIESGCIKCNWCSDLAPEVFIFGDDGSEIRADARVDQTTSANRVERARLSVRFDQQMSEFLEFVAAGCPSNVIKFERDEQPAPA